MAEEFRGMSKVVDHPSAVRGLRRPGSAAGSRSSSAVAAPVSHVFDPPCSEPLRSGRRHTSEFSRMNSKTSLFGSEESSRPARNTGRKHTDPTDTVFATDAPAPRVHQRKTLAPRTATALSAAAMRPLGAGEKPPVYGAKDGMSWRPHGPQHGRAHIDSENRRSIIFGRPTAAAASTTDNNTSNGGAAAEADVRSRDPEAARRYDPRYTRPVQQMQRFECRPALVRTVGINEQPPRSKGGKLVRPPNTCTLEGVLNVDRHPKTVDATKRPQFPGGIDARWAN